MSKADEQAYPDRISDLLGISESEVRRHLLQKPFGDPLCSRYMIDLGQIRSLLPPPPARVLDLGCGAGWTSRFFAQCGYAVVGVDISETMIARAREAAVGTPDVTFVARDYERPLDLGEFDAAVIYDALHHAEDEAAAIGTAYRALKPGGILITAEPGATHSTQPASIEAMARFGVTEKDMEYDRQRRHMLACGFSQVRQFVRLSEAAVLDLAPDGGAKQREHLNSLMFQTLEAGFTSIVVAVKVPNEDIRAERDAALAERDAALAERDAALAERDASLAERDAALAELAAMKASSSWRVTAPIRDFLRAVRR